MKKIIFTLVIITLSLVSYCQIPMTSANGRALFQTVIEVDSVPADELYQKVNRWILNTYKSPDDVVKASIENELVRGEGYADNAIETSLVLIGGLKYSFKIDVKEGKVRFTMYDMKCLFPKQQWEVDTYVLKRDGTFRTNYQATDVKDGCTRVANDLIRSLESALINADRPEDW